MSHRENLSTGGLVSIHVSDVTRNQSVDYSLGLIVVIIDTLSPEFMASIISNGAVTTTWVYRTATLGSNKEKASFREGPTA